MDFWALTLFLFLRLHSSRVKMCLDSLVNKIIRFLVHPGLKFLLRWDLLYEWKAIEAPMLEVLYFTAVYSIHLKWWTVHTRVNSRVLPLEKKKTTWLCSYCRNHSHDLLFHPGTVASSICCLTCTWQDCWNEGEFIFLLEFFGKNKSDYHRFLSMLFVWRVATNS